MAEYTVTARIELDVEAESEEEAKEVAQEQFGDFLRHHSFTELMEVREVSIT